MRTRAALAAVIPDPRGPVLTAVGRAVDRQDETEALARVGSWELDCTTGLMTCTAGLRRICGLPPDAPAPDAATYAALVHPDDRADLRAAVRRLVTEGTPYEREHRLLLGDEVRWVRVCATADTADGRVLRAWGAAQDITGLRRSQTDLAQERDRSAALFAALSDGCAFTSGGVLREVNAAFCQLTGLDRSELLGTGAPYPFWAPEHAEVTAALVERTRTEQGGEVEVTWRHRDGSRIEVALTVRPVRDSAGEQMGWVTLARDVTDRRRAMRELADSQQMLAEAQRQALLGSWTLELATGGLRWSEQMFVLCGLTGPDITPQASLERVHPQDREHYTAAFAAGLLSRERHTVQYRVVRPDGTVRHVTGTAVVECDPGTGRAVRVRGSAQDVTALHHRQGELERQTAHLRAIAAASHAVLTDADPRQAICRAAHDVSDALSVTLFEVRGGRLVATASGGTTPQPPVDRDLGATDSLLVRVQRSGRPVLVEDTQGHAVTDLPGAQSALCLPVLGAAVHGIDGEIVGAGRPVIGVLAAALSAAPPDGALELLAVLQVLADEAGVAIERTDLQRRLVEQARTDGLTGLPNRRTWEAELPLMLARAGRSGAPLCLAMLDLDHFKSYNDTHGHAAGDDLLRAASGAWTDQLRVTDLLARYGGEEFVLALPDCDLTDAAGLLERLRSVVPGGASVSVGLTRWDRHEIGPSAVARADSALYEAKHCGRDQIRIRLPRHVPAVTPR